MRLVRQKGTALDPGLNMTPMIDVVFQLLIFFMIGCKFRVPEGELDAYLPEKGRPGPPRPELAIHVQLRVAQGGEDNPEAAPSVLVDGKVCPMQRLEAELGRLAADKETRERVRVVIEAEPGLAYRWVVQALNGCRKARFEHVGFAVSKRAAGVREPEEGT